MTVWIVGRQLNDKFDFQGVFSTKEKAIKACVHQDNWIGPAILDEVLDPNPEAWQGCYYPNLETEDHEALENLK